MALRYQSLSPADVETLIGFVKDHGVRTITFPTDADKKRRLSSVEQKLRKERTLYAREQVEGGSRMFEAIESGDEDEPE
jgi:hypothetical protein